jgi:hypothetical protein
MDKMSGDENIDNIAQTFFLLMILCSVISDSHFVIHERSPRIQYLFDSLQALFIFGFTQKQQERIVWESPVESSVEEGLSRVLDSCKETPAESSVEEGLSRVLDSCKETPAESSVEEEKPTRVSFQEPIQTVHPTETPPKKKKLLEDRKKEKITKKPHKEVRKEKPLKTTKIKAI